MGLAGLARDAAAPSAMAPRRPRGRAGWRRYAAVWARPARRPAVRACWSWSSGRNGSPTWAAAGRGLAQRDESLPRPPSWPARPCCRARRTARTRMLRGARRGRWAGQDLAVAGGAGGGRAAVASHPAAVRLQCRRLHMVLLPPGASPARAAPPHRHDARRQRAANNAVWPRARRQPRRPGVIRKGLTWRSGRNGQLSCGRGQAAAS